MVMKIMKKKKEEVLSDILIIGVGGAGCNIVEGFRQRFTQRVVLTACDQYNYDKNEAYKMLDRNSRNVYIVTGLGGEFGTRVAPAIAHECKKAGKITIGIAIMPFSFEGNIKYERALQGVNELSRNTDAIFLLNNQSILKNNRKMSINEAFKKRDHMLCQIIKSINSSIISTETTDSNILGCLKWLNKTYHTLFVRHTKENHKKK